MRNVTGVPVEDDDFFDRGHEIERFLQEIRNNANLLLTTPRRVGKTSLVLRLCRVLKGQNFAVAFFDVEGCSDELANSSTGPTPRLQKRSSNIFAGARKAARGARFSMP